MLFLFFPVRTDAPVYHFPYATLGLIVANVLCFIVTWVMPLFFHVGDADAYMDLMCVTLGATIQPIKWISASFYHFDPGHLIFNMLFLWTFGLIVEGKLGWLRFLVLCAAVNMIGIGAIQVLFWSLNNEQLAGGASVMLSALVIISFLWAPKNEIGLAYFVWLLFYIRLGVWDIAVSSFTMIYLALQALNALVAGSFVTSETMHFVGFLTGGVVGAWMLKAKLVDCENWDLFSVMRGEHGRQLKSAVYDDVDASLGPSAKTKNSIRARKEKARREREKQESDEGDRLTPSERATAKIQRLLKQKKARAALQVLNERRQVESDFAIPAPSQLKLAQQLHELGRTDTSVQLLLEYLDTNPTEAERVRLMTAKLMIEEQSRPSAAKRILDPIDAGELTDTDRKRLKALIAKADGLIESGVIELGDGAW